MTGGPGGRVGEDFRDVFAARAKGSGARGPDGVAAEKVTVLLHGGAAARGVNDDRFHVHSLEGGDHFSGKGGGVFIKAGVDHKGSAAFLLPWNDNLKAFGGKNADGGFVDVLEEDLLDASGEHADSPSCFGR